MDAAARSGAYRVTRLLAGAWLLGACATDRVDRTRDGREIETVHCDNYTGDLSRCFSLAHLACPDAYDVVERSPDSLARWLWTRDHGLGETVEPSSAQYLRVACRAR